MIQSRKAVKGLLSGWDGCLVWIESKMKLPIVGLACLLRLAMKTSDLATCTMVKSVACFLGGS